VISHLSSEILTHLDPLLSSFLTLHGIEYLVINQDFTIAAFSPSARPYAESYFDLGSDVRLGFPELATFESQLLETVQSKFELKGVTRSRENFPNLYFDLRAIALQNNQILITLENATARIHLEQTLVQRANASDLLLNAISDSKRYIEQIITSMTDALLITTPSGIIKTINPATQALFGYTPEELIGHSILKLLPSPESISETSTELETLCQTKSGRKIPISFSYSVVQTDLQGCQGFIYLVRNLSERKQAETAKREFLGMMGHELRTPMNAIIGMTSLLLSLDLPSQQKRFIEIIRNSSDALLMILNDILDFSKIESGDLQLEEYPFDLHTCIGEALDLIAPKAIEKKLELIFLNYPELPSTIVGDMGRLQQILVNLLDNAVKFTESGEIVVSVTSFPIQDHHDQAPTYQLQFAVRDTGIGIPAELSDRLFKSFSQVDSSTTRQYGGTGLGLAISKQLCEMMGGKIWVESQPNWGSTFYFTVAAPVLSEDVCLIAADTLTLEGKKVLIVDDHAIAREALKLQAQFWKMPFEMARSSSDAFTFLRQTGFDLALIDAEMPGMEASALVENIRKSPNGQTLPLLLLSTSNQIPDIADPFVGMVKKPIKQAQLYEAMMQVLDQDRSADLSVMPKLDRSFSDRYPLKILLAEDSIVNQKIFLRTLQQLGYKADLAQNGLEVLAALHRQTYDLILMDVQMPEMDGLTAARHISRFWEGQDRPTIIAMLSNGENLPEAQEYCQIGISDRITKPIRLEDLMQILERRGGDSNPR
jgi:PAS domain S-box-containing protein